MNIWKNIAIFFGGILTGFLILTRIKKPDTVINADTYIKDQEQKIGKIKQKGQGNEQEVVVDQSAVSKKESRKAKRLSRKSKSK